MADHIAQLPPEDYRESAVELGGASIGQHVRHCLDHVTTATANLAIANLAIHRFDYDVRARDVGLECDRDRAIDTLHGLARELRKLQTDDLQREVWVRTASSSVGEVAWHRSSLGRELQFLVSHTVHHAAMIAASCRVRGLSMPDDFGVAPSTLRFRASTS